MAEEENEGVVEDKDALAKLVETQKKELAGLDRRISELSKENEKLRQSGPTDSEGKVTELLDKLEAKEKALALREHAVSVAAEEGIPVKVALQMVGQDQDETDDNLDALRQFKESIYTSRDSEIVKNTRRVASKPAAGPRSPPPERRSTNGFDIERMSPDELLRLPEDTRKALIGGGE